MEESLSQLFLPRTIFAGSTDSEPQKSVRVERKLELPNPWVVEQEQLVLSFDIETVAAGFADPDWVPQKITCVAWSWVGSDKVESRICGPLGIFGEPQRRAQMLKPLLVEIDKAHVLTGHNIARFDLPVINAECMRLGLHPIRKAKVQDTMKLPRSKGFKKGLDNLSRLYRVPGEKMPLDWQAWQDAYDEAGWETIRRRCESDVMLHKQTRLALIERGLIKGNKDWKG